MINITIDTREDVNQIKMLLSNVEGITLETRQLHHGDFLLNDTVVFERKTLADFIASVKDKRLFRQSYKSLNCNVPYVLILEGKQASIKKTGMSRKAVQGALVYLSVSLGIPTLRSVNLKETLQLILMTGRQGLKAMDNRQVFLNHQKARMDSTTRLRLQILQNLPGIGQQKAHDILRAFGSLKRFFNANEHDLLQIEGIGKKTVERIMRVIKD